MDTIVLTTANSSTAEQHKYSYKLTNTIHLKGHKICLSNLSIYYTWKNIKAEYNNNVMSYHVIDHNKTKVIVLPDGSYSINDINNYLHMAMVQNGDAVKDDYPISIYSNPTFNRVTVTVKPNFEFIMGQGMAGVLGYSNPVITSTSNGDLVPKLERVEAVLVHCNLAQNSFTQDSSLIFSFVPDNIFGSQLHQKPNFPLWRQTRKTHETEIDIWFTDQLYRPLEIEDNILIEIQLTQSKE